MDLANPLIPFVTVRLFLFGGQHYQLGPGRENGLAVGMSKVSLMEPTRLSEYAAAF